MAGADADDMDFGAVTGQPDEDEEENLVYAERAWIDDQGVYRTPESWKDPWRVPTDPTDWGFGPIFRGPHYSPTMNIPEGKSLDDLVPWEDWKDAPTQIPEEILPRKCPEPDVDWERDPKTGEPKVWEDYKKQFLDHLPKPEVLDRDLTEEEVEDLVELIYHRMYLRGVRFFPVDGQPRKVKRSKRKTKKGTWGNELDGSLPLLGPEGPGSKKVGEQWPPIWRPEDIPLSCADNVTDKFWEGNAAQADTTGREYGYVDETGQAVQGTVPGKLADYYDTSVEDHERMLKEAGEEAHDSDKE